jgi:hypothetical protein
MKTLAKHQRPTTYRGIVQHACDQHARRIAELKRAEKQIHAIEPDLARLDEAQIGFDVGDYSMHLRDVSNPAAGEQRARWALHISAGVFSSSEDKLIAGFIGLGWIVESGRTSAGPGTIVLRKPKTQVRVHLHGRPEYVRSLLPKEDE